MHAFTSLSRPQAAKLGTFTKAWLTAVVPEADRVRVIRPHGRVQVRDPLGWRDCGTLDDFVGVARALGPL